jgi:AcrR family transcriptional regulator
VREAALALFATRGYENTTMVEIAESLGIRAPSLYNHVASKHALLRAVMIGTMESLLDLHEQAVSGRDSQRDALLAATEAHVLYHARHRAEAFVGSREMSSLEPDARDELLTLRDAYERSFRGVIRAGVRSGDFHVASTRLAAYAILEMGIGVSTWFRPDGPLTAQKVARQYGVFALRIVGAEGVD